MGLSDHKQTSSGTTAVTYGYQTPPETADLIKLRGAKFEVDPGLHAEYGNLRNRVDKAAHDPMGAAYNPQVAGQQRSSAMERLGQEEAQAYREGQFDVNKLNFARDSAVANMTHPVLTQTGGSSTGTTVQSQSPFGEIAKFASSAAPLSL